MGLVEDPGRDLRLASALGEAPVPELLGRDEHDARLAELDPVEHLLALGRREQPVQGDCGIDALPHQIVDLILHQGLQRRDNHRQLAASPVVRQGGS